MPEHGRRVLALALIAAATLAGCGGSGGSSDATGGTVLATSPSTPSAPSVTRLEVAFAGGTVTGGGRQEVALGKEVALTVTADVADEVHLHGYDRRVDVAPGTSASLTFTADIPGIFEVELESRGVKLMELVVR